MTVSKTNEADKILPAFVFWGLILFTGVVGVDRIRVWQAYRKFRRRATAKDIEQKRMIEEANEKLERIQAQLVQQEKLAVIGQLMAGIAHEVKSPLNFVNNFAANVIELTGDLRKELTRLGESGDEEIRDEIEGILFDLEVTARKIGEHGKRVDRIVKSMLEHARDSARERQQVQLNVLVEENLNFAYHGMRAQMPGLSVTIDREYDQAVDKIDVVPHEIGRVLLNLFQNAFYAVNNRKASDGESYHPAIRVSTLREPDALTLRIEDNGPGIPEVIRDKIFEPFFTTKPSGQGTGLGLSLSREIVEHGHGGKLEVISEEGKGTTFIIQLPVSPAPQQGTESDLVTANKNQN